MSVSEHTTQRGFTLVEILIAIVVFPIIVAGLTGVFEAVKKSYTMSRQLNEIYAVLSACPEIDRALDYDSLTSSSNCYPNNTFAAENGGANTLTYTPTLTVSDTSSLASSDPLYAIPSSKVVDVKVNFLKNTTAQLEVRMLVTRNGIGQQ